MKIRVSQLLLLLLGFSYYSKAASFSNSERDAAFILAQSERFIDCESVCEESVSGSNSEVIQMKGLAKKYHAAFQENKRLTAAMLTFALGMLGVHRLYLGTKPWIPAVYLFTCGGGFLVLPLIDFGVILFSKDISKFEHNDRVLMWVK
ncbi:MAG: TM2 domain-containing protein [Bacteroidetes bacterium]|nr:TM2 domain-containing protein [Bacteroidota bacterium]MBK9672741.1 TM2 domain-containing protein [Bacteroidota bacterium]MBK9800857.1 TM2 domain-containing protein [Bacteroidota bacterium]MBP6412592.1 TM2 domain-containing protein [Bacteroidia bacterium]